MTHYHVGANVPGYMPDGDIETYANKRDAASAVADMARIFRDDQAGWLRSERRTGEGNAKGGRIYFSRPGDSHDLGIVFWWEACNETDCETNDDA